MNIEKLITSPSLIERSEFDAYLADPITFKLTSVSEGLIRSTGYSRTELQNMHLFDLNADFKHEKMKRILTPLLGGERQYLMINTRRSNKDGSITTVEGCLQIITTESNQRSLVVMVNPSGQVRPKTYCRNLTQEIVENFPDMAVITDSQLNLLHFNKQFGTFFNIHSRIVIGAPLEMALLPERLDALKYAASEISETGDYDHVVWCRINNKRVYPIKISGQRMQQESNDNSLYLLTFKEILTNGQLQLKQIENNPLDHLQDRVSFLYDVELETYGWNSNSQKLAVIVFDIAGFKRFNDRFGYELANEILYAIAQRIKNYQSGILNQSYLGADQFALLIEVGHESDSLQRFITGLTDRLTMPYSVSKKLVYINFNVGAATFSGQQTGGLSLLDQAEHAMNQAKVDDHTSWCEYNTHQHDVTKQRFDYEAELRTAFEKDQFSLVFQPQLDLKTGQVISAEALLRWNHPEHGVISPAMFIDLLEETDLIVPIGDWVIQNACEFNQYWQSHGLAPIKVAVNVSAKQLTDGHIITQVKKCLKLTGINPSQLELEITESSLISNLDQVIEILKKLHQLNVTIAMDDFGTGYSSLMHLKKLPIDILKIDKTFVDGIIGDEKDRDIINTIIQLAKNFEMEVIAEGVETKAQLDYLRGTDCNKIQGYIFAKPMSAVEFEVFLTNNQQENITSPKLNVKLPN